MVGTSRITTCTGRTAPASSGRARRRDRMRPGRCAVHGFLVTSIVLLVVVGAIHAGSRIAARRPGAPAAAPVTVPVATDGRTGAGSDDDPDARIEARGAVPAEARAVQGDMRGDASAETREPRIPPAPDRATVGASAAGRVHRASPVRRRREAVCVRGVAARTTGLRLTTPRPAGARRRTRCASAACSGACTPAWSRATGGRGVPARSADRRRCRAGGSRRSAGACGD